MARDEPDLVVFADGPSAAECSDWPAFQRRSDDARLLASGVPAETIAAYRESTEEAAAPLAALDHDPFPESHISRPHPIAKVMISPSGRVTFVPRVPPRFAAAMAPITAAACARPRERRARRSGSSRRGPPSSRSGDDEPPPLEPHPGGVGVPAVVVRVELEAAPHVYFDCISESEQSRLLDWLSAHPDLLDALLAIVGEQA